MSESFESLAKPNETSESPEETETVEAKIERADAEAREQINEKLGDVFVRVRNRTREGVFTGNDGREYQVNSVPDCMACGPYALADEWDKYTFDIAEANQPNQAA